MPRRNQGGERRKAYRVPRPTVLILCGAEKTEVAYFSGLRQYLGSRAIDIVLAEKSGAPDQVVRFAGAYGTEDGFDERWCVVDVDHFERDGNKVTQAIAAARAGGIQVAVSNPCFEYWLLIHHADRAFPAHLCRDVEVALRKFVPGYDKTQLKFADYVGGLADAVDRAKKRDPSGRAAHTVNPSSGVWVLVEKLLEQR